jgi:hypothetical protein
MKPGRHGAAAICALWLLASFAAPALLLTDGLFLALLLTGMLFLGLALWAAVPAAALLLALRHLGRRQVRAALPLLLVPVLGLALCYGGGRFWWALRRASLPPSYACAVAAAGSWHCPEAAARLAPFARPVAGQSAASDQ